jgi:hypothetical protein
MPIDIDHLQGWIGRTETVEDVVTAAPLRVGQAITRTSRITDVRLKDGKTGPLVEHPLVRKISFIGSDAIGRRIAGARERHRRGARSPDPSATDSPPARRGGTPAPPPSGCPCGAQATARRTERKSKRARL